MPAGIYDPVFVTGRSLMHALKAAGVSALQWTFQESLRTFVPGKMNIAYSAGICNTVIG